MLQINILIQNVQNRFENIFVALREGKGFKYSAIPSIDKIHICKGIPFCLIDHIHQGINFQVKHVMPIGLGTNLKSTCNFLLLYLRK